MPSDKKLLGIEVSTGQVPPEWIDINGHMNVAYYSLAFDLGVDALWSRFGLTDDYICSNQSSTFAVESHLLYRRELKLDDPYIITAQILAFDQKRIHQFQRMYHATEGFLAATAEWMSLHVDMKSRRVAPWPDNILDGIDKLAALQNDATWPDTAGRKMSIGKPLFAIAGASGGSGT